MESCLAIGKENLKHNMWIHILICAAMLLLSPLVLGVSNLPAAGTAKVLEMYISLLGIVLLTPIFLPEQDQNIRDLVYVKKTNYIKVYVIRLVSALLVLAIFLLFYMLFLKAGGCEMKFLPLYGGTLATMICFGGLGIFAYALTNHQIIGYMLPFVYYVIAVGKGAKMGVFNPFSITMAGSYDAKVYLLFAGVILIGLGFMIRYHLFTTVWLMYMPGGLTKKH